MERANDSIPNNEIKMVIGDLNAKLGGEDVYKGVIGKQSLHLETNNNGQRVIYLAISKSMIVASTCFPRMEIHKITWTSPDGNASNQIDQASAETRRASNILDVRSYRGANCDSDHYLVRIKYRGRITTKINKNNTCRHKDKLQTNRLRSNGEKGNTKNWKKL
jgi:hypothetical protein